MLRSQTQKRLYEDISLYKVLVVEADIQKLTEIFYFEEDTVVRFLDMVPSVQCNIDWGQVNLNSIEKLDANIDKYIKKREKSFIVLDERRSCLIYKFEIPAKYEFQKCFEEESFLILYDVDNDRFEAKEIDAKGLIKILEDLL